MGTDVLDFAGLDAAVSEPVVESSTTEVTPTEVQISTTDEPTQQTNNQVDSTTQQTNTQVDSDAQGSAEQAAADEPLPGDEKTPQEIRKILKAVKDANPANAAAVKQLHGAFERYNAYTQHFPTVKEAEDAKSFIDSIGGYEGYENTQAILQDVEASDALLFDGDPKIISDVYESMKAEGKQDNFPKLLTPLLSKVSEVAPKEFASSMLPHHISYLEKANLPNVLVSLSNILAGVVDQEGKVNTELLQAAGETVKDIQTWFNGAKGAVDKAKLQEVNPERLALQKEREAFEKEKTERAQEETKKFRTGVANTNESANNNLLGKELNKYLKTAYFKAFKRESLVPLAQTLQLNLRSELEKDKAYQTQMKGFWSQKSPDKAKIEQYHRTKVESMVERIVRDTVNLMYPDHSRGGSAAGRVAAAKQKQEATQQKVAAATSSGKPIYVDKKPTAEYRDFEKDPKDLLQIAGKAYLKKAWNNLPAGTLVTWRK